MRLTLNSRELVLHGPVLLLLDAVLVVAGQHTPVLLPVVDRPIIIIIIVVIIIISCQTWARTQPHTPAQLSRPETFEWET